MTLHLNCQVRRGDLDLKIDASFPPGQVTALFGASGSGKTSILRLIAGLDHDRDVQVRFRDDIWQDEHTFVPTWKRRVGLVFQNLNLFPNMTAGQNLDYAEKRAPDSQGPGREEIVDTLQIHDLMTRQARLLSGGEQQRVAIARALLSRPGLLMLDEPLGSVDQAAKHRILPYLQQVNQFLDIPVILVSHSLDEVLYLADRVLEINAGKLVRRASVTDYSTSETAATRHEAAAILHCTVSAREEEYDLTLLSFEEETLRINSVNLPIGSRIRVRVPARDVSLVRERPEGSSIVNLIECRVVAIDDPGSGPTAMIQLGCGGQLLLARITRKSLHDLSIQVGETLFAQIKGVALMNDEGPASNHARHHA